MNEQKLHSASTGKQWTQPIGFAHALVEGAGHRDDLGTCIDLIQSITEDTQ